jgi:hypothetical protein
VFAALEHKVQLLETTLKGHSDRLSDLENLGPEHGRLHDQLPILVSRLSDHIAANDDVVINIEGIKDSSHDHSMTDGMAVSFVDEQDCGFFGRCTQKQARITSWVAWLIFTFLVV